ncbi:hypothetical protein [Paenibacillus lutrae]|uniref:Uncharacterized protein n=1 Tax=Paenibacillus lutrae TaxID=2078573 RepID=A0A7X3JZP5_9BACL|nr:hypothetical protein [Paenibacillus lutrae]MVP00308.1 hypothetical protein [Paenibacillus lutrae]
MIKQYFAEISLTGEDTLSDSLNTLVNRAENEFGTPYIEIAQIVPTQADHYTVILNLDFPQAQGESRA